MGETGSGFLTCKLGGLRFFFALVCVSKIELIYAMTTTARASCQGIRLTLNLVAPPNQLNLIVSTRPRAELKGSKPARSDSSGPLSTERYCEQYASERARRWQINLESIRSDFHHFVNPTVT